MNANRIRISQPEDDPDDEDDDFRLNPDIFEGMIHVTDDQTGEQRYAGIWCAYHVDIERAIQEGEDTFAVVDDTDQALFDLCDALYQANFTRFKPTVRQLFPEQVTTPNVLVIDYLAVHPDFIGQGVGRVAMEQIIEKCRLRANLVALATVPLQDGFEPYWPSMEPGSPYRLDYGKLDPDTERATAKLQAAFSAMGFQRLSDTDYMLRAVT